MFHANIPCCPNLHTSTKCLCINLLWSAKLPICVDIFIIRPTRPSCTDGSLWPSCNLKTLINKSVFNNLL
jgi:hypothetical protein